MKTMMEVFFGMEVLPNIPRRIHQRRATAEWETIPNRMKPSNDIVVVVEQEESNSSVIAAA